MRFFTDHDVDAAVSRRLRALGHDAWTAEQAGLRDAADLLERHLGAVLPLLGAFDDLFIVISHEGLEVSHSWE